MPSACTNLLYKSAAFLLTITQFRAAPVFYLDNYHVPAVRMSFRLLPLALALAAALISVDGKHIQIFALPGEQTFPISAQFSQMANIIHLKLKLSHSGEVM